MDKTLKQKNIPKLLEDYEKYLINGMKYSEAVLIEIIKNLNARICELEHAKLIEDLNNGQDKRSIDGDS